MKKFVAGMLFGAILMLGVSVSAANISAIIGKKVDGTMTVSVDGKKLEKEAAIINGTSYIPVRDATNAINGEIVSVQNKHIEIVTKGGAAVSVDEQKLVNEMRITSLLSTKEDQLSRLQANIDAREKYFKDSEGVYNWGGGDQQLKDTPAYPILLEELNQLKAEAETLKDEIADLKDQLAALQ